MFGFTSAAAGVEGVDGVVDGMGLVGVPGAWGACCDDAPAPPGCFAFTELSDTKKNAPRPKLRVPSLQKALPC